MDYLLLVWYIDTYSLHSISSLLYQLPEVRVGSREIPSTSNLFGVSWGIMEGEYTNMQTLSSNLKITMLKTVQAYQLGGI